MSWPSLSWRNAAYASALSSSPSGTLEHWLHMVTGSHISSHLHCQSSETQPRLSYFHRLLWENLTTDTGSQLGISSPSLTTLGTFSHFLLTVLKHSFIPGPLVLEAIHLFLKTPIVLLGATQFWVLRGLQSGSRLWVLSASEAQNPFSSNHPLPHCLLGCQLQGKI